MNPDVIARELPLGRDGRPDVLAAGRRAVQAREQLVADRESLAIETTLSGRGELDFATRAKLAGYELRLFYIGLGGVALSVERVALRVSEGGHDVPRADLFRRFDRSLANLPVALELADRAYVFENSGLQRRLVLARINGRTRVVPRRLPPWLEAAVPPDLRDPSSA